MKKTSLVKSDVTVLASGQDVSEVSDTDALKALGTSNTGGAMSISVINSREKLGRWLASKTVNDVAVGLHLVQSWLERVAEDLVDEAVKPGAEMQAKVAAASALRDIALASNACAQTRLRVAEINSVRQRKKAANVVGPQFNIEAENLQIVQPAAPTSGE